MARRQKLKVFRTPTGFHDAYVAAPSRKAALEAWGSDADLFARGIAEVVTDEELSREPLANPGKVIRRSRGTAAEQLAALPPGMPRRPIPRADAEDDGEHGAEEPVVRRKRSTSRTGGVARPMSDDRIGPAPSGKSPAKSQPSTKPKAGPKPRSRPSRAKLDKAESGLAAIIERQESEQAVLRERERELEKERRTMEAAHERERRAAERAVEREREAHFERHGRWIETND